MELVDGLEAGKRYNIHYIVFLILHVLSSLIYDCVTCCGHV